MEDEGNKTIYVGGFGDQVNEKDLYEAFVIFGDIIQVQIPADASKRQGLKYAFVEFSQQKSAFDAIDNMNNNVLKSYILTVNLSRKTNKYKLGSNRAVWQDEEWLKQHAAEPAQSV